MNNCISNITVQ